MAQALVTLPPSGPSAVAADARSDPRQSVVRIAGALNQALRGNISATLQVTLVAGATTSTFNDSRIGPFSHIGFTPLNAHAAAALPGLWVEIGDKSATIHHANSPNTDQTFNVCIIGG